MYKRRKRPTPPDLPGEWLTTAELAEKIGTSKSTVMKHVLSEEDPLPHARNEQKIIFVEWKEAQRYFEKNPVHKSKRPTPPDLPGEWLTTAELAEKIGICKSTIIKRVLLEKDPLPHVRNEQKIIFVEWKEAQRYFEENPVHKRKKPTPPDLPGEWVTLTELAEEFGVTKARIKRYMLSEENHIKHERNWDGVIFVERKEVEKYLEDNPAISKPLSNKVDREPTDDEAPKTEYLTLKEAALESDLSSDQVRNIIRSKNIKYWKNARGWILIPRCEMHKIRAAAWTKPTENGEDEPYKPSASMQRQFDYYKDILDVPGVFISTKMAAEKLGVGEDLVRSWIHRKEKPLPFLKMKRKILINKYRLIEFVIANEVKQVA